MSIFPLVRQPQTSSERFPARFGAQQGRNVHQRVSPRQHLLVELQADLFGFGFVSGVGEFELAAGAVLVTPPLCAMGCTIRSKNDQQGVLFDAD